MAWVGGEFYHKNLGSGEALMCIDMKVRVAHMTPTMTQVKTLTKPLPRAEFEYGSKHRLKYPVSTMADGTRIGIPLMVVQGSADGPTLVCVAGIHGDEYEGITALIELFPQLDPENLAGQVIFIPVANPPAFRAGGRRNPEDRVDMNRIFPGNDSGTVTEQLAHALLEDIIGHPDLLLSMHGFTNDSMVLPYTEYSSESDVSGVSASAARAFGLEYIEEYDWPDGMMTAVASKNGIPSIEPEIGGLGCTLPRRRERYKQGVRNLLRFLDMIPDDPQLPETIYEIAHHHLHATKGGVLSRHIELGEDVQVGDPIFDVLDLTGGKLETIKTPVEGVVAQQRLRGSVNPGDLSAIVFEIKKNIS